MFYEMGPWSTVLTDNFWWSFILRKKIVIITIIIVIIIIIIISISLLLSSSSHYHHYYHYHYYHHHHYYLDIDRKMLGYWERKKLCKIPITVRAQVWMQKTSASVFAKYTERQKKLITSLEQHSLKSKALKWIKIGHRLAIVLLTKHISKSKCLRVKKE